MGNLSWTNFVCHDKLLFIEQCVSDDSPYLNDVSDASANMF